MTSKMESEGWGWEQKERFDELIPSSVAESHKSINASPRDDDLDGVPRNKHGIYDVSKMRKKTPIWTERFRIRSQDGLEGPNDDGYSWRKYGQKHSRGAKHRRSYYGCAYRSTHNCSAKKRVQRTDEDPTVFEITYQGIHTCCNRQQLVPSPASPETLVPSLASPETQGQKQSDIDESCITNDVSLPLYFETLPCQEVHSIKSDKSEEMSMGSRELETIFGQQYYENTNWHKLLLSDFPSIFGVKQPPKSMQQQEICPTHLIRLNLQNIEIDTPWKGQQPLVNLKSINFSYSKLSRLPDLSHAPKLKRLNMQSCIHIIEASSFESLSNLEYINLQGCTNLKSLPSMLGLKSLDILILTGCFRLGELPELSRGTKRLLLSEIGIEELPASIGCLTGLVELDLSNCERLKKLPSSIFNLTSLVTLNVSGCTGLMKDTKRNRK